MLKNEWAGGVLQQIFAGLSAGLDGHLPTEDMFFSHNIFLNVTQKHAHTQTAMICRGVIGGRERVEILL